ncbi:hypothetical protein GCM10020229_60200 [Kitasatospora albolonga]
MWDVPDVVEAGLVGGGEAEVRAGDVGGDVGEAVGRGVVGGEPVTEGGGPAGAGGGGHGAPLGEEFEDQPAADEAVGAEDEGGHGYSL